MELDFVTQQFSLSTADEERNLFTGKSISAPHFVPTNVMPAGTYRVIDGKMFRVVDGVSPALAAKIAASQQR